MPQLHVNNFNATLASGITAAATTLTLAPGAGARLPAPSGGDYFLLTLYQMSGATEVNHEVVRCTSRSTDTCTVVRAQEGTTARAFNSADPVSMRLTAGALAPAALGTVGSVGATAPVVSSGGTAPVISMPAATSALAGYLTAADWTAFNGKQAALGFTPYNATNPAGYTSNLGTVTGVTATAPLVSSGGATPNISVAAAAAGVGGYLTGTDWSTFNGKQAAITGAASTITAINLTASRALVSDAGGKVGVSAATAAELGYLAGVTSAVQTQIDGKQPALNGILALVKSAYPQVTLKDSDAGANLGQWGLWVNDGADSFAIGPQDDMGTGTQRFQVTRTGIMKNWGAQFALDNNAASSDTSVIVDGKAGYSKTLNFKTGNLNRWTVFSNQTAEAGSNSGSDFAIGRYNDAGVYQDSPLSIIRSSGNVSIANDLWVNGGDIVASNLLMQGDGTNAYIRPTNASSKLYLGAASTNTVAIDSASMTVTGTASFSGLTKADVGGGVATANAGLVVYNGNQQGIQVLGKAGAGAWNPITQANDAAIILQGGATSDAANGLVIAPWASSASGMRMTISGCTFSGTLAATGTLRADQGVVASSNNALRMKQTTGASGYGVIHRNDGADYYMLLTNQNDADGTWNGARPFGIRLATGDVTMSQNVTLGAALNLTGAAGATRATTLQTAGVARWQYGAGTGAEAGSNAGSDFYVNRFNDAGAYIDTPMQIVRSTGVVSMTSLTVQNLIVNGSSTRVDSTIVTLDDPVLTLGGDTAPTVDDNKDRGIEFRWHNGTGAKTGFFGFDDSTGKFTFIPDASNASEVFSGAKGELDANVAWTNLLNKPTTWAGFGIAMGSGSGLDADKLQGWSSSQSPAGGTIVQRGAFGSVSATGFYAADNNPVISLQNTSGAANEKNWDVIATGNQLKFRYNTDSLTSPYSWMEVTRSAMYITSIELKTDVLVTGKLKPNATELKVSSLGTTVFGTQTLDLRAGAEFTATLTGNTTFAFSYAPGAGQSQIVILRLTNAGSYSITWPVNTKFPGGTVGTLTASGVDILGVKYDSTTSTYMVFVIGKDVK